MADTIELGAVESLAMNHANIMSSTKSSIGHLLELLAQWKLFFQYYQFEIKLFHQL